jgi:exosortase
MIRSIQIEEKPAGLENLDWKFTWNPVLVVAFLLALALYAAPLASLAYDWQHDEGASYGFLVPPIALYIAYMGRKRTFAIPARTDSRGVILVLAACFTFLVGQLGGEFFTTRFSLVMLLAGLVWTFWGLARLRTLVLPFALLVTMIPLPAIIYNKVAVPLQLFASQAATWTVQAFGGSIYRDGNVLELPNITLGVAEACSGLHSLASMVVASLLLAYIECDRTLVRLLLIGLSVPLAIFVNVVRVTGTAFLAGYNPEYASGFYHAFSGWLVFIAGFGGLWIIAKLLRRLLEPHAARVN